MELPTAFTALRDALDIRHRETTTAAFAQVDGSAIPSGIAPLDRILGGGFPKGTIATLEGAASSGRSAVAAQLLAAATETGLAALVEWPAGPDHGILFPPGLDAAGVRLERLLVVRVEQALDVVRAADIILRSGAFPVVLMPALPPSKSITSAAWTRLASLAHRSSTLVVAHGTEAGDELRYFASIRLELAIERVRWTAEDSVLSEIAGYEVRADVRKHKRAAPGGTAHFVCEPFTERAPLGPLRVRDVGIERTPSRRVARG